MKKAATAKKTKVQATVGASTYVRPQEMEWAPTQFDKVYMKVLYQDQAKGELTCLVKLEPGAKLPMHVHPELEQAFVLEGSMADHDGVCRAGEYVWRTAGSYHENQSDEGAIVLAIYRKLNIFQNSVGFERGKAGY